MIETNNHADVDLRSLRALVAVADQGSFRGAARELGYTQSAISHQIATLERSLETSLFTRTSPGRYTLRALAGVAVPSDSAMLRPVASASTPSMSALPQRKPAAPAQTAPRTRDSDVQGGGFAG